jgi:hypothetical protein
MSSTWRSTALAVRSRAGQTTAAIPNVGNHHRPRTKPSKIIVGIISPSLPSQV